MRPTAALIVLASALLLAGCGTDSGTGGENADDSPAAPPGETLEALWRAPGDDVRLVAGTVDHAVGANRLSFLVVDQASELVERPSARVWVARGLERPPFAETTARLERIGVPGGTRADAPSIYVATVDLPAPGTYWLLAEPVGGTRVQALGKLVAATRSAAPGVGDRAVRSETPTLRSTGGDLAALTTSRTPDAELYRTSIAEALDAREPFVVSFATPQHCRSRTCAPVLDVVSSVRDDARGTGVRFIHVEIYEGNDPEHGVNRWVEEWQLPTEPFTFVVDGDGVIRARFEGAFSAAELETAVRSVS